MLSCVEGIEMHNNTQTSSYAPPRRKTNARFVAGMRFTICHSLKVNGNPARLDTYFTGDIAKYEVVGIWHPDDNAVKHLGNTTKKAVHLYGDEINGIKYVYIETKGELQGVEYITLNNHGMPIKVYATDCIGGE